MAIQAAKDMSLSQGAKLVQAGVLEVERPIQILGHSVGTAAPSVLGTLERKTTKTIHFQRHGQGYHNLICDLWREWGQPIDFDSSDPKLNPVVRPECLDPPLTHVGVQQCRARQAQCNSLYPQAIIVSPLLRCLQTAQASFAAPHHSVTHIPWVAHEGCREELGLLVGNQRRPRSEIQQDYPQIDLSQVVHHDDVLWQTYGTERRETVLEKADRIYDFLTNFVAHRPEDDLAIVTHSAYLFTLLNGVVHVQDEDLKRWFLTSEVQSLQLSFYE